MKQVLAAFLVVVLTGCAGMSWPSSRSSDTSPCAVSEASQACQVERYRQAAML